MKRAFLIAFCSVVALSACQRSESTSATDTSVTATTETASTMAMDTSATSTPAATSPYDLQFIDSLTKHHQMAIDMARAAEPKFEHQPLKEAAKKMIDDQTKEIAQLRAWRDQWYPGAAPAENMQMPGMAPMQGMDMSHLHSMSGNALDLMFMDMMIPHHEGALAMGQDALAKAEHQELKDLARKMIDMQTKEIGQMREWKTAWTK